MADNLFKFIDYLSYIKILNQIQLYIKFQRIHDLKMNLSEKQLILCHQILVWHPFGLFIIKYFKRLGEKSILHWKMRQNNQENGQITLAY